MNEAEANIPKSPLKGKTGITRLINAFGYSCAGLRACWENESAFRQEVMMAIVLIPLAIYLPLPIASKGYLIASVLLVMVIELLNSAIEAIVDWISIEKHPLAKRAKDIGSAAVLVSLVMLATIWGCTLAPLLTSLH